MSGKLRISKIGMPDQSPASCAFGLAIISLMACVIFAMMGQPVLAALFIGPFLILALFGLKELSNSTSVYNSAHFGEQAVNNAAIRTALLHPSKHVVVFGRRKGGHRDVRQINYPAESDQ